MIHQPHNYDDLLPVNDYEQNNKNNKNNKIILIIIGFILLLLIAFIGGYTYKSLSTPQKPVHSQVTTPTPLTGARNTYVVDAVKKVSPAVVGITKKVYNRDIYNRNVLVSEDIGSGFIFDKKGYIATNYHVVASPTDNKVIVSLANGKTIPGKVIGTDPATDLAVVKIEPYPNMVVAPLGDSSSLQVGESAIPINQAKPILTALIEHGHVIRPYLGIYLLDQFMAERLGHPFKPEGLLIIRVVPGGPAAQAHLQPGDIITQFNGVTIKNLVQFKETLDSYHPNERIALSFLRKGETYSTTIRVLAAPAPK